MNEIDKGSCRLVRPDQERIIVAVRAPNTEREVSVSIPWDIWLKMTHGHRTFFPPEPTEGQVERAIDLAMSWQPSERGLSYAERRREVMDLLMPALRAMPLQDHAVTQDKRHD